MKTKLTYILGILIVVMMVIVMPGQGGESILGSVTGGNEYSSLVIDSTSASSTASTFAKLGVGALGSVIINRPSTAITSTIDIYDAASATSTGRLLTRFNVTNVAKTYTFDIPFNSGLLIDVTDGFDGEYTITWR